MVSGLWFRVYGFRFMVSGLWFQVYGFRFMVDNSVHPESETQNALRGVNPFGVGNVHQVIHGQFHINPAFAGAN